MNQVRKQDHEVVTEGKESHFKQNGHLNISFLLKIEYKSFAAQTNVVRDTSWCPQQTTELQM